MSESMYNTLKNSQSSSLTARETILGVLKSKDIDNTNIIHSSDFRTAISDLGFLMGSKIIEDILIHCTMCEDGTIDFNLLESDLQLERIEFNKNIKLKHNNVITTSKSMSQTAFNTEIKLKNNDTDQQFRLLKSNRVDVYDVFKQFSTGKINIEEVYDSITKIGLNVTNTFKLLMNKNQVTEVTFVEFNKALGDTTIASTSFAGKINENLLDENNFFATRKRVDTNRREILINISKDDLKIPRRKTVMDVDSTGSRPRFKTSKDVQETIFNDKDSKITSLSHARMQMEKGLVDGELHVVQYTSEEKLLREQVLAALRKLDAGVLTREGFETLCFQMKLELPEQVMTEIKMSQATGRLNFKKLVQLLDTSYFKVKALENQVSKETIKIKLNNFINKLKSLGVSGINQLNTAFKEFDINCDGGLSLNEFKMCFENFGILNDETLTKDDIRILFNQFDRNGDGSISSNEFINGIRSEMDPLRSKYVRYAYSMLDREGNNKVIIDDFLEGFSINDHPDVKNNKKNNGEINQELINFFSLQCKNGEISFEIFQNYFSCLSTFIEDTDEFITMMKNSWGLGDKSPPPQIINQSSFGKNYIIDSAPIAKQHHGDCISWDQSVSGLEISSTYQGQSKKHVPESKAGLHQNKAQFDANWVVDKKNKESMEEYRNSEWKAQTGKQLNNIDTKKNKESRSDFLSWDPDKSKSISSSQPAKNFQAPKVIIKKPKNFEELLQNPEYKGLKKENTANKFQHFGDAPFDLDFIAPYVAKSKQQPKSLTDQLIKNAKEAELMSDKKVEVSITKKIKSLQDILSEEINSTTN
jgi:Ca2+-binding EF-hand superfamily protein